MLKRALTAAGAVAVAALASAAIDPAAAGSIGRIGNFTISRPVVTPHVPAARPTVLLPRLAVPRAASTSGTLNTTGRVSGIAVDPSARGPRFTAGPTNSRTTTQAGGGAWKTKDGGHTWHSPRDPQLKAATQTGSSSRYFNGLVNRFSQGGRDSY